MTDRPTDVRRPVVVMLMYPDFTHLDLVGPHAAFAFATEVHLAGKTLDPVTSDSGMQVVPTTTLAGLDFGLSVLAELLGEDVARTAQLATEYDPAPPFDSGSPERVSRAHVEAVRAAIQPVNDEIARAAGSAA